MEEETCDRCGPAVRAYVYAEIGDTYLAYCGSCATRYWSRLNEAADRVIDMRHLIPS